MSKVKMSEINFNDVQKFSLRAPKGKIMKSNVYSAYTKNKVSSIPSKVEIILLRSPDELKLTTTTKKNINNNKYK